MKEITTIQIEAKRLGTVSEVTNMLTDLETAYNKLYAFDYIVDVLIERPSLLERRSIEKKSIEKRSIEKRIAERRSRGRSRRSIHYYIQEFESKTDINKIILPDERLVISKVNIQTPGFWEFMGAINPLEQIGKYLRDRRKRTKDCRYRNRQEEEIRDLEIMRKENKAIQGRIRILKKLDYNEDEIRRLLMSMVVKPLNKLGQHQDNGQIE